MCTAGDSTGWDVGPPVGSGTSGPVVGSPPHRLIWQAAPGHALPRFLGRECEAGLDFSFSPDQLQLRDAVAQLCAGFDDQYWLARDSDGAFPHAFHQAIAEGGWL